jgi:hypothetical protein
VRKNCITLTSVHLRSTVSSTLPRYQHDLRSVHFCRCCTRERCQHVVQLRLKCGVAVAVRSSRPKKRTTHLRLQLYAPCASVFFRLRLGSAVTPETLQHPMSLPVSNNRNRCFRLVHSATFSSLSILQSLINNKTNPHNHCAFVLPLRSTSCSSSLSSLNPSSKSRLNLVSLHKLSTLPPLTSLS